MSTAVADPGSALARTRVLVVDDNEMNAELACFVLEAGDFEVACAGDATAAMRALAFFQPHVVLMDIQLPGTDGLALTSRIKSDAATAGIVVIAFTAYAMKGEEAKMLDAGCDGYIAKPIDVRSFAQAVRTCVESSAGLARDAQPSAPSSVTAGA